MTIFSKDSSAVSAESREFLKEFIEVLNTTKRVKMEVVEYLDPKRIEVREVK